MEPTSAGELGQKLAEFLLQQFAPAPGSRHTLGFLGTGVAVTPDAFLSQGEFNPARINSWLDVVADPLAVIPREGGAVIPAGWTAMSLMEAIAGTARTTSPANSEEQQTFARAKSDLMEKLGGATVINTAPLDWYDPAQVAKWPTCSLQVQTRQSTGTSTCSGTGSGGVQTPPIIPRRPPVVALRAGPLLEPAPQPQAQPPLWAWRVLDKLAIEPAPAAAPEAPPATAPAGAPAAELPDAARLHPLLRPGGLKHLVVSQNLAASAVSTAAPPKVRADLRLLRPAERIDAGNANVLAIERAPTAVISEVVDRHTSIANAVLVSKAMARAAQQAATTSVASTSMSLSLSYQVVSLSRAPWWSELLLLLNNWYIPSLPRGALVDDSNAAQVGGAAVALILTSNVMIKANWSESDRSTARASTHFGPWALEAMEFRESGTAGEAVLAIPGIQAIACVYRDLPAIPPQPDPDLAASAAAAPGPLSAPVPAPAAPPG